MLKKQEMLCINDLQIQISWKKVKHLRLMVSAGDEIIKVSAPLSVNKTTIESFVNSRLDWIKQQQNKYQNQPVKPKLMFLDGETHYLFGKPYTLKTEDSHSVKKSQILINDSHLILFINSSASMQMREKVLYEFYRSELKKTIPALIRKWELIIGKKVAEWKLRKMKTRWGSCNIRLKRIWLNLELAKSSPECLEYVIVHEMVHLYERYHNKRFYQLMDRFLPDWKLIKKQLNSN